MTKLPHTVVSTRLAKSLPLTLGPATSIASPLTDMCRSRHLTLSFFPLASAGLPAPFTLTANCHASENTVIKHPQLAGGALQEIESPADVTSSATELVENNGRR